MTNPVEMKPGQFARWAEETFGMDYDDIRALDMVRTLDTPVAEQPKGTVEILAELRDILLARKAVRPAPRPSTLNIASGFESEWVERGSSDGE